MLKSKTVKIMLLILAAYFSLWALSYLVPSTFDSPLGLIVAIPFMSIYLFHSIGIPGLLQHHGACGWGWCAPSVFGLVFIITFWLLMVWLFARFIVSLTQNANESN